MLSIVRVVGALSCSILLCLSLSAVASSADKPTTEEFEAGMEVKGKIVKIEGENYVVRQASGNEVRVHVDATTRRRSSLAAKPKVGDNVITKVDEKGHAHSFFTDAPLSH